MEFQVRVSSECIHYLKLLEEVYSKDFVGNATRGMIINKAFEESKAVINWLEIYEDKHSISLSDLEYSGGNGTKINAEISEAVNDGIRELKLELPNYLPVRSVTLGVTVRLVCKAALLINMKGKPNLDKISSISSEFDALEERLKEIIAPINYKKLSKQISYSKSRIIKENK